MFNMDNTGFLVGRVAKVKSNSKLAEVLLITDVPHQDQGTPHFVKAFGKTAQRLAQEKSGSLLRMRCHLHSTQWTDSEGNIRYNTDVICDFYLKCESKKQIEDRANKKSLAAE